MCTAMTLKSPEGTIFFGRTMDFSYPLDPELYYFPKGYQWKNILKTHIIQNKYKIMGIGQNVSPVILAEGVNEKGFAAAALYFPGYAQYDSIPQESEKPAIAALELVNFLLGQCASTKEAVKILEDIIIAGVKDMVTDSIAPLHWILADTDGGCVTVEKTCSGLHCMENTIGVLSNSPDFQWHMTNLRNYMNVIPYQYEEQDWSLIKLFPFGQGGGTKGLPGDYTPPSRFVKTAYQKSHAFVPADKKGAVMACFHIMEGVSIPKGAVMTSRKTSDYTQYTSFIDLSCGKYYFKTYDNSRITSVNFAKGKDGPGSFVISAGKLNRPVEFEEWGMV